MVRVPRTPVELDLPVSTVEQAEKLLRWARASPAVRFPRVLRVGPAGRVHLSTWWPFSAPALSAELVQRAGRVQLCGELRETYWRLVPLLGVAVGLLLALGRLGMALGMALIAFVMSRRLRRVRGMPVRAGAWAQTRRGEADEYARILAEAIARGSGGRPASGRPRNQTGPL